MSTTDKALTAPFQWHPGDSIRTKLEKLIGVGKVLGNSTDRDEAALDMLCDPDREAAGAYDRPHLVVSLRKTAWIYDGEQMHSMRNYFNQIADMVERRERLT